MFIMSQRKDFWSSTEYSEKLETAFIDEEHAFVPQEKFDYEALKEKKVILIVDGYSDKKNSLSHPFSALWDLIKGYLPKEYGCIIGFSWPGINTKDELDQKKISVAKDSLSSVIKNLQKIECIIDIIAHSHGVGLVEASLRENAPIRHLVSLGPVLPKVSPKEEKFLKKEQSFSQHILFYSVNDSLFDRETLEHSLKESSISTPKDKWIDSSLVVTNTMQFCSSSQVFACVKEILFNKKQIPTNPLIISNLKFVNLITKKEFTILALNQKQPLKLQLLFYFFNNLQLLKTKIAYGKKI